MPHFTVCDGGEAAGAAPVLAGGAAAREQAARETSVPTTIDVNRLQIMEFVGF
jgi:hypothetical protein